MIQNFGIGIFAISEMARFYRHVLIAKRYPHHGGVAFKHAGKVLFAAMKMLGWKTLLSINPPACCHKNENPFK